MRAGKTLRIELVPGAARAILTSLAAIRSRKAFWEDAAAGHHAAACAHMVNQAARLERTVRWDFAKDDLAS